MSNRRLSPLLAILIAGLLSAQVSQSDRQRFEEIKARHDRGEAVSTQDRQFAQSVMAQIQQTAAAQQNSDYARTHPARESTGLVALPDLGEAQYHGEQGGLYPGGRNSPPAPHLAAGLDLAKKVAPLDAEGHASAAGHIVLLTIGMSNTTQETQAFLKLAAADRNVNPQVTLVDGAQGGQTARITADPAANYWKVAEERLTEAGVTPKQVQAVWIKQANAGPAAAFPAETKKLQADLVATLHNLHSRYPNLKLAYLSSRIYGGYASTPLNPEPHAYEGGFAVKWTIAAQIAPQIAPQIDGDGGPLNYDPAKGAVRAPWIAWGPYLWADGIAGRRQDGLVWTREDLGPDGTHPSNSGREKVGKLLLEFLKTDATARVWFVRAH